MRKNRNRTRGITVMLELKIPLNSGVTPELKIPSNGGTRGHTARYKLSGAHSRVY